MNVEEVWRSLAPWLDWSPEVRGAVIQSVGTLSAAALAVWGAKSAVHSWKHDAPGRRALAIAEQCIVLAHQLEAESADLEKSVEMICKNVRQIYDTTKNDNDGIEFLTQQITRVSRIHDELSVQCGIADIYFGLGLVHMVSQTRPYVGKLHLAAVFSKSVLKVGGSRERIAEMTMRDLAEIAPHTDIKKNYSDSINRIREGLAPKLRLKV